MPSNFKEAIQSLKNGDVLVISLHSNPRCFQDGKTFVEWKDFWKHFDVDPSQAPRLKNVVVCGCMISFTGSSHLYSGHYFMVYADRDYNDLRSLYVETNPSVNWNDRISSLKVGKNACVTFWQDINYRGSKGTYEADGRNVKAVSSLVGPGWNDKISSIKIRFNGNCAKS